MSETSTAISYIILAISAMYCLSTMVYKDGGTIKKHFCNGTFLIIGLNATLGVAKFIFEESMYHTRHFIEYAQYVLAVPLLACDVWLKHNVGSKEMAWAHAALGCMQIMIYSMHGFPNSDLTDITVAGSLLSLGGVGMLYENDFALLGALLFFIGYFYFYQQDTIYDLPARDMYNYCTACFIFCALLAV